MNRFLFLLFLSSLALSSVQAVAQKNEQGQIDSLQNVLKKLPPDTNRVKTLLKLCDIYQHNDINKWETNLKEATDIATRLNYRKGIAETYYFQGLLEYAKGNFAAAKKKYNEAFVIYEELKDQFKMAQMIYNIGVLEVYTGNYAKANEYFFKTLHIYELLGKKENISNCYTAIGNVYGRQGNGEKELEFHKKSLALRLEEKDKYGISASYINIGNAYGRKQQFDTALDYYFKGLKISEEIHNQKWIVNCLGNIGSVYVQQKKYKEGLQYLSKGLDMAETIGDKKSIATYLNTLGQCYSSMKDYKNAKSFSEKALEVGKNTGNKEEIKTSYLDLAEIASSTGDYKSAYNYHILFGNIKDSILNEENSQQINEMQAKYDNDKQEQEISLLNKDKEIQSANLKQQKANLKQQKIVIIAVVCGLLLSLVFAIFVFRQYTEKQKANTELQSAYHLIEEKNKDITDSINYAKRIQTAILPSVEHIQNFLPESFINYQPKDIVSGDFYWFTEKNGKLIIAVADCTGHGVPGAFMSMIGNDLLTQIIIEKGITQPNLILTHLHEGVKNALKQDADSSKTKDGMDIALIAINKNDHSAIEYAGALRPLWAVKKTDGTLTEYKADKHSIGGAYSAEQKEFTNNPISLQKGDVIYLFTDGYADQFGGEQGKKFMSKNMKELLRGIRDLTMEEQKNKIHASFTDWKKNREQVDDVLVIGIRI
jgi:serine phosphatase RsbU (regulator of sigma subunit)